MKKIKKGPVPASLVQWKSVNAAVPQNLFYGEGNFPRDSVLDELLKDQGQICAYTLKRINNTSAHIEHLKPQAQCKSEDELREAAGQLRLREDVAWGNLVACFPEPNAAAAPSYGAVKKHEWWHSLNFISPLNASCENRFGFNSEGGISPVTATDFPAEITIEKIGLDDKKLCELRKTAYLSAGIHRRAPKPIQSVVKIEQLIAQWSAKNADTGSFSEFCVPLIQVAKEYAQFLRARGINE